MAIRREKEVKKSTGLELVLDLVAWLILLAGIAGAIYTFVTLGTINVDDGLSGAKTETNAMGVMASLSIVLSSIFGFALIGGISELIRLNKFQCNLPYRGRIYRLEMVHVCSECNHEHDYPVFWCSGCRAELKGEESS